MRSFLGRSAGAMRQARGDSIFHSGIGPSHMTVGLKIWLVGKFSVRDLSRNSRHKHCVLPLSGSHALLPAWILLDIATLHTWASNLRAAELETPSQWPACEWLVCADRACPILAAHIATLNETLGNFDRIHCHPPVRTNELKADDAGPGHGIFRHFLSQPRHVRGRSR